MFDENVSSNGINFDFIVIDEPRNVSNKRPKRMPRKQKKYFKKCEEIERLKEQLLGISFDVIVKANPFLSKLVEYMQELSKKERQSVCEHLPSSDGEEFHYGMIDEMTGSRVLEIERSLHGTQKK